MAWLLLGYGLAATVPSRYGLAATVPLACENNTKSVC
jgi:hypothetical protein